VDDRAPIQKWEARFELTGEHESPHSAAKRAATAITDARKTAMGQQYLKSWGIEATDAEAYAVADNAAALGRKPSDGPITKITPVRDDGSVAPPLIDNQPITEDISFRNLNEAKRAMQNVRALQDVEREELLNQFQQRQEQAAQVEQQRAPQEHAVAAEPQRPTAQSQAQPDPLARERAALNQKYIEATASAEYARMWADERQAADAVAKWDDYGRRQPELKDNQVLANTVERAKRGDRAAVARLNELHKAHQAREQWYQRFNHLNQVRVTQQMRLEHHQEQQRRAAYDQAKTQADDAFNAWIKAEHPHYATEKGRAELQRAARSYVRDELKMTAEEQRLHWEQTGYLRNLPAQKSIALAAMQKLGRAKLKELPSKRIPPVQGHAPGVFMGDLRGEDTAQEIAALQRQLDAAPNERQALKLAQRLTRMKRAAGQLAV